MPKARLGIELNFEAADKVGLLNEISTSLADNAVNIETISAWIQDGKARFRIVTSDNATAMDVLKGKGYEVRENEVVLYELENRAGAAAEMTGKLAAAGISMKYIYGTTGAANAPALLVFGSDNNEKAVGLLNA